MRRLYLSIRSQGGVRLIAGLSMLMGVFSQGIFLLVDTLHKITSRVNDTWVMTKFYEMIDYKKDMTAILDVIFVRELAIHGTRIVFCLLLAAISAVATSAHRGLILPLLLVMVITPLSTLFFLRALRLQPVTPHS